MNAQVSHNDYIDYHVHVQDSATVQLGYVMLKAFGEKPKAIDSLVLDADTVIDRLNRAKFRKAWIISNAYWFGSPFTPVENEYEIVKKQNDWVAGQAARYSERLMPFMSVNPLKPYALAEIKRCVDSGHFKGIKLHFANSKVNLFDKSQISQLQKVFGLANKYHLILLVHLRSGENWNGNANAKIFIKDLLSVTKETKVVIAHMGGWGGFDKDTDAAFRLLHARMKAASKNSRNLYFDTSAVLSSGKDEKQPTAIKKNRAELPILVKAIRELGTEHILFGTDWPVIDIDPYINLLTRALGSVNTKKILSNTVSEN